MVSKYKTRAAGVRGLVCLDDYNEAFFLCFGLLSIDVMRLPLFNYYRVLYIYGLRKKCGYTYAKMALLMCDGAGISTFKSVVLACRLLCVYDAKYSVEFAAAYKRLKAVCKPFKRVLSNAERCKNYQQKQQHFKKRTQKSNATRAKNKEKLSKL